MPTRNVVLTEHHETVIASLVDSGRYQNASEVLRDGLRMLEASEERRAAKLLALREAAQAGFDAIDDGRFHDFATMAALTEHLTAATEAAMGASSTDRSPSGPE